MAVYIETALPDTASTTDRGRVLEKLTSSVLGRMNYAVKEEIRLTGMEVDVLAQHRMTGETVYAECKAHSQPISAAVIRQLLGTIQIRDVASGWLITTSPLTKDGKGLKLEWENKPPEQRRRLQLYDPQDLVDVLTASGTLAPATQCKLPTGYEYAQEPHLLLTSTTHYWCWPVIDPASGARTALFAFDATHATPVTTHQHLQQLSSLATTLRELEWLPALDTADPAPEVPSLASELDNVVAIPSADSWADYRPARPRDFVGRDELQANVFRFLEDVRDQKTSTRLMALKAPSGWGKSSTILKLIDRSRNRRHRGKFYMAGVDCRAAVSPRYAELAFLQCFRRAADDGFIPRPVGGFRLQSVAQPFADQSIASAVEYLRNTQKVLVIVFDQFEEIFSKQELSTLFRELRSLSDAIDAGQENVVFAFSWKTDGTIPQDHPAYHMWQRLADRRVEYPLTPFTSKEISRSLTIFEKQIDDALNPQVRRLLSDQCQGFPWLLKKLCIHVYQSVQRGVEQIEIANKALNVKELFESELHALTGSELACIKRIARDSPAEFYEIEDSFGGNVIRDLIDKRIVMRTGSRLMLYWDIFRDYVLTEKVPNIPVSYIPQSDPSRYTTAAKQLLQEGHLSYSDLSRQLGVSRATADNVVRDLVMVGNASAERKSERIKRLQYNEADCAKTVHQFCRNHILIRTLIEQKGADFVITWNDLAKTLKAIFPAARYAESTWTVYGNRLASWCLSFGILHEHHGALRHASDGQITSLPASVTRNKRGQRRPLFLGDAPPERVLDAFHLLQHEGQISESQQGRMRNAFYVLTALGLAHRERSVITPTTSAQQTSLVQLLISSLNDADTFCKARTVYQNNPSITPIDLGGAVAHEIGTNWVDGSKRRYGAALKRWIEWEFRNSRAE